MINMHVRRCREHLAHVGQGVDLDQLAARADPGCVVDLAVESIRSATLRQQLTPRRKIELPIFVAKHMCAVSIYCICWIMQNPQVAHITLVHVIHRLIRASCEDEELIADRPTFIGKTCVQKSLEAVALYAVGLGQHVREALQKTRHVFLLEALAQAVQKSVSNLPLR